MSGNRWVQRRPCGRPSAGFTLVELLVVITIIVILLAMLMPAMDKAIYRAELTLCGATLHSMGSAVLTYAMHNRRVYPNRRAVDAESHWKWPSILAETDHNLDIRPLLESYMSAELFLCPLSPKVSYRPEDTAGNGPNEGLPEVVFSAYNLWFGLNYIGRPGMRRIGDQVEFFNVAVNEVSRYRVLASDHEQISASQTWGAHPDREGQMWPSSHQAELIAYPAPHVMVWTKWYMAGRRGSVDKTFVMDDGSVRMLDAVTAYDPRVTPIGVLTTSPGAAPDDIYWADLIPRAGQ